jgi:putative ABC transport system permease protein
VPSLKQGERSVADHGHRLHDLLVTGECAMAVVLLVGAGLLVRSFLQLQRPDTGFDPRGLLTVGLSLSGSPRGESELRPAFLAGLAEEIEALPGVEGAAFVNHVPIGGDTWRTRFSIEGRPVPDPADVPQAVMRTASPEYLSAMGIALVRGRTFDEADRADSAPVVLVNQTLARRFWADADPVGARITLGRLDSDPTWRIVVGVFADARQSGPVDPVDPEILFPYAQDPVGWFQGTTLVVRTEGDPRALGEGAVAWLRAAAPEVPVTRVRTMPELLSGALTRERFGALLMGLLSAMALALAVGGMYGVMAYAVGRRGREIGIRLALGARPGEVLAMVLREGLRLGVVGAGFGLAGALALSRVLRSQLYDVSPFDPATFAGVGILLLAAAALGALVPARRAARLDPVVVLRES